MDISFLTPTYAGDIERFALLRQTIEKFANDYHHTAVVHSEDFQLFRERFHGSKNLTLLRTNEVLPKEIESRRQTSSRLVNGIKRRVFGNRISGWHAQQLTKIFALAQIEHAAAAFIDSDLFLCKPLANDYFIQSGKLKLFRRPASNAESMAYDISTHDIVGNRIHDITELYDFIFQPAVFKKTTAISLIELLSTKHGSNWHDRFLREKRPSEFNLLGYIAAKVENLSGYQVNLCNPSDLHYSIRYQGDEEKLQLELDKINNQAYRDDQKHFFLVQSNLRIESNLINQAVTKLVA